MYRIAIYRSAIARTSGVALLDLAVLGLLEEGPLHGYELRRRLADYGFWSVSFGSLYPALRRLERAGLIEDVTEAGARRKAYHVTPAGEDRFRELMLEELPEGDDDRAFSLRLAFLRHVAPEDRIGVLERRRDVLSARLRSASERLQQLGARAKERMDRYTLSLMEHGVRTTEADLTWLEELIEDEQAQRQRTRRAPRGAAEPA